MKVRRIILVLMVVIITFCCMARINIKYDRLSRYQYSNPEARELINLYLSDENIEYIIEYAIEPSYFIDYIKCSNFSIYHCDYYHAVKKAYWHESNERIVEYAEFVRNNVDEPLDFILKYSDYSFDEIYFYFNNLNEMELVENPLSYDCIYEKGKTISSFKPYDLIDDGEMVLRQEAYTRYHELISFLCETYNTNILEIIVSNSYLSYNQRNEHNISSYDHQLGLSLDLDLSNSVINNDENFEIFEKSLSEFGFVFEKCDLCEYHIRYKAWAKESINLK